MRIGIIGDGAISRYVQEAALERGHEIAALVLRTKYLPRRGEEPSGVLCVDTVAELPDDIDVVVFR